MTTLHFIQKSKKREREDEEEDELDDKPKAKPSKKQKNNHAVPSKPGRYVLVNPQPDDESNDDDGTEEKEEADVHETTDLEADVLEATDLIVRPWSALNPLLKTENFCCSLCFSNGKQSESLMSY